MRVAIVHDYLNQAGGAEKVVEVLCAMFPDAPVYTSVYDTDAMPDFWRGIDVRTTFMQRLTPRLRIAKQLLLFYPAAFESLDLTKYDLVLSSCSTFSKGVITSPSSVHVCYCHNTTRFAWMYHEYIAHEPLGTLQRAVLPSLVTPLRLWDFQAAQRVDHFVANSRTTHDRIRKFYRRPATIIEPPIETAKFAAGDAGDGGYFLIVSRLQPYKRLDLAVAAATRLGLKLIVAGRGPDLARLRGLAGPSVEFTGYVSDQDRTALLQRCTALIVPGTEDFGMTALEAQAAGRPVIAFGAGGALETVIDGVTGTFFREQSSQCLSTILSAFDPGKYNPQACRAQAARFDVGMFRKRLMSHITKVMAEHEQRQGEWSRPHDD
jgi:glycosyltransferase involved in cell wall biosynthesis